MNYRELSDTALIQLIQKGDKTAFSYIYERYWAVLFFHARKLIGNEEEAKDIVQNLFVTLLSNIQNIDFKISLSAYLYRSVKNMILDHIKHEKVVNRYLESFNDFIDQGELITENEIRRKELENVIEKGIQSLPDKMKEVFLLSRREDLSHKEIAQKLGISKHTIKSQINNAIRILRVKVSACGLNLFI